MILYDESVARLLVWHALIRRFSPRARAYARCAPKSIVLCRICNKPRNRKRVAPDPPSSRRLSYHFAGQIMGVGSSDETGIVTSNPSVVQPAMLKMAMR